MVAAAELDGANQPVRGLTTGDGERAESSARYRVMVVDDEDRVRKAVTVGLRAAGYDVTAVPDGATALGMIQDTRPDVVVSDVTMPGMNGLQLLERIRSSPEVRETPVILLTARSDMDHIVAGFDKGADDYIPKPFAMQELVARVRAKLDRPPMPADLHPLERSIGVMSWNSFRTEVAREVARVVRGGRPGVLACIDIHESAVLRERLGVAAVDRLWREVADVMARGLRPLDLVGKAEDAGLCLLLPEISVEDAYVVLGQLGREIAGREHRAGGDLVRVTSVIGYAALEDVPLGDLFERAGSAAGHAAERLDLEPLAWSAGLRPLVPRAESGAGHGRWRGGLVVAGQLLAVGSVALVVPFLAYVAAYRAGVDVVPYVYLAVVAALLLTAGLIWVEAILARRRTDPPPVRGPYPAAAAIIAAYLPNEAATIAETVRSFLAVTYPGPFEVIVAYNTPHDLPIESVLRDMAGVDRRLRLIRVAGSISKAQNVNHALGLTGADMIGIFDADHHPEPGSFTRAWQWLAAGNDVVQGHNLVRNGAQNWLTRLVSVEFELMYGVSHPGRARLHGFGIFGGSNGYWRASALRRTRMHGLMLTEDIDSSMRVIAAGGRIVSDPSLVSRELAPTTLRALWNQRLRWAQGWFQVSLRHLWRALRSPSLTTRQKVGIVHLTVWREVYPWLSLQIFPIMAFWVWRAGGVDRLDWLVPVFVLTTVFTFATGPAQTAFAFALGHSDIRRHRRWFGWHMVASILFYSTFKAIVSLVAQVRQFSGDRQWRVTPRGNAVRSAR